MRGWLVGVDGMLTPQTRSLLSDASIAVRAEHHGGTGLRNMRGFTVEVDAEDPDQASVKVAEALGADGSSGFSVREVNPADERTSRH